MRTVPVILAVLALSCGGSEPPPETPSQPTAEPAAAPPEPPAASPPAASAEPAAAAPAPAPPPEPPKVSTLKRGQLEEIKNKATPKGKNAKPLTKDDVVKKLGDAQRTAGDKIYYYAKSGKKCAELELTVGSDGNVSGQN